MRTHLQSIILLGALLSGAWPGVLHAGQPEQGQQELAVPGFLLVASQQMMDSRFRRTVILVSRHGKTGHVGVIINRPQDITLDKILPEYPAARNFTLYEGGPVYPKQISFLVRGADAVKGTLAISGNIYLAYDLSLLGELLNGKRRYKDLRVVNGMASWAPGQLEHEIKLGDWYSIPLDDADIFDLPPAEMWQELYRRATRIEV